MRRIFAAAVVMSLLAGCNSRSGSTDLASDDMNAGAEAPSPGVTDAMIFCREIDRRTTRADCDDLTEVASKARNGTAAFNAPDMVRERPSPIELSISLAAPETVPIDIPATKLDTGTADLNLAGLDEASPAATPAATPSARPTLAPVRRSARETERPEDDVAALPGRTERYSPLVGRDMRAELIGQGFRIVAQSPASQVLSPGGTTTWNWQVTPLRSADYALTIKTSVEGVMADGTRVVLGSTTRTRAVTVTVRWYDTLWDWLAGAPLWIAAIGAVIVALTLLVWRVRRLGDAVHGKGEPPKDAG